MNRGKAMPTRKKTSTTKSRRASTTRPRAKKRPAPPPLEEPQAPLVVVAAEPEPEPAPAIESAPLEELPLSSPEVLFAERVVPDEPDRPYPAIRRAIFFDVENTSRAQHIARVVDHLKINRGGHRTEFIAVGNWRVIGHDTARLLARYGAHLVHSAPSVGVRDWSDLRIAVTAGAWLAGARPGDQIEIVSDDRAFDAVGDVAASLGIAFRRLSYRGLAGAPPEEAPRAVPEPSAAESRPASGDRRGQRYRGRYRGRRDGRHGAPSPASPAPAPAPPPRVPVVVESAPAEEPHTAPHDEIIGVVRDLVRANPGRAVSIDTVANALKARGFSRPPGSPRLITRLRRLKEIELTRTGMITLVDSTPRHADPTPRHVDPEPPQVDADTDDDDDPPPPQIVPDEPEPIEDDEEGPQPGNERVPSKTPPVAAAAAAAAAGRRRRRGGRRRRGRGRPQTSAAS
jgi:hypothetical protein